MNAVLKLAAVGTLSAAVWTVLHVSGIGPALAPALGFLVALALTGTASGCLSAAVIIALRRQAGDATKEGV